MKFIRCAIGLLVIVMCGCIRPASTGIGGLGGKAVLVVTPTHRELNVDSCKIYIKYNAQDAPLNGAYDDSQSVKLQDTVPVAFFTGLLNGNYYIYAYGYHAAYFTNVKGGIGIKIAAQDTIRYLLPTSSF